VGVDRENVGPQSYDWKSECPLSQVEIDPNTDKFKPGLYKVVYVTRPADPKKQDQQTANPVICAKLVFEEVPKMTKLNNSSEALSVTVGDDAAYFRYVLPEGIDYEDHWILL